MFVSLYFNTGRKTGVVLETYPCSCNEAKQACDIFSSQEILPKMTDQAFRTHSPDLPRPVIAAQGAKAPPQTNNIVDPINLAFPLCLWLCFIFPSFLLSAPSSAGLGWYQGKASIPWLPTLGSQDSYPVSPATWFSVPGPCWPPTRSASALAV